MRTEVEIVVEAGRSPRVRATGGLAVRRTGTSRAHLIGTAATPLGGDHIEVLVHLAEATSLDLGSVAAMIALPAADRAESTSRWRIEVGAGARLRLDPQPTVVAGGAHHDSVIEVHADADATIDLHEHIQIGRSAVDHPGDDAGRWRGRLHVDVDRRPILRHGLELGAGSACATAGFNALTSVFRYPDASPAHVDADHFAARLALVADASLTTALGRRVAQARAHCDALDVAALAQI
ncbi:urease accessory protein UreD [Gordonia polyisoprenivorans]|uniref:urease accessory protein UreD n=1 Tax=Gordonia polyisoprenivorans TaxID=84595 RepID=UPI002234D044|nr:urease accessory protein UreD [Gordonia polyisoprenivorans]